jgi:PAS domain S-box-containing protein
MTNLNVPTVRSKSTWARQLGSAEFGAVLNLINEPAALVDIRAKSILLGNSELLKLTAFSQNELNSLSINELLPAFLCEVLSIDSQELVLKRRNREAIPVRVKINAINKDGDLAVITIIPEDLVRADPVRQMEKMYRWITELVELIQKPDTKSVIQTALEASRHLFSAGLVCIYLMDRESDAPRLVKVATNETKSIFPQEITVVDYPKLAAPNIWTTGKRMSTELQRAGRVNNLAYLASYPLGFEKNLDGLIVAADTHKQPLPNLMLSMEYVAISVSRALAHFEFLKNIQKKNEILSNTLNIRNSLFEFSNEGILVLDTDFRVLELNPTAELMLGYTSSEARGQPSESLIIGTDRLTRALDVARKGIETPKLTNLALHHRDGNIFPAEIQIVPVVRDEIVLAILVWVLDISENEQIRLHSQQLEQRAILGEFSAIFAHDVRGPLNNISTGVQMVAANIGTPEMRQEALKNIQNECNRINNLMNQVLNFSRPLEPKPEVMDVGQCFDLILQRYRPRFTKNNITTYVQADKTLPKIMGDPRLLDQVFTNLLNNAIEAMTDMGGGALSIQIALGEEQGNSSQILIKIADTGPGIPEDIKARIFDPFVTTKKTGTGLGLPIVKRIITAHHGNIHADSFPGGTVFHLVLPAITEKEE